MMSTDNREPAREKVLFGTRAYWSDNLEMAGKLFREASELWEWDEKWDEVGRTCVALGRIYRLNSGLTQAEIEFDRAIKIAKGKGDATLKFMATEELARTYYYFSGRDKRHFEKAEKLYLHKMDRLADPSATWHHTVVLMRQAIIECDKGNVSEARKRLDRASEFAEDVKDYAGKADALGNVCLARAYLFLRQEKGQKCVDEVLLYAGYSAKSGLPRSVGYALALAAQYHLRVEDVIMATRCAAVARRLLKNVRVRILRDVAQPQELLHIIGKDNPMEYDEGLKSLLDSVVDSGQDLLLPYVDRETMLRLIGNKEEFVRSLAADLGEEVPGVDANTKPGAGKSSQAERPTVFISYSHEDRDWMERLLRHLKVHEYEQQFETWYDSRIRGGDDWDARICGALNRAKVAVFLVSTDSLTSRYIREVELPHLLQRRAHDGLPLCPLIVEPAPYKQVKSLKRILARPTDGSLAELGRAEQERALTDFAREIRELIEK